jgi:hypothetical protein
MRCASATSASGSVRDLDPDLALGDELCERRELVRGRLHNERLHTHAPPLRLLLGRCARDHDQHAALAYRLEHLRGDLTTDGVESDVGVCERVCGRFAGVIDVAVGTESDDEVLVVRGADPRDDGAAVLGELDREVPDAPGRARDHGGLPALQVRTVEQRLPGRHPRDG